MFKVNNKGAINNNVTDAFILVYLLNLYMFYTFF